MGILPPPKYPRVVKQPPKKLTFSTTSVLQYLGGKTIPEGGTRHKITGIVLICNEPGRSMLSYCAHVTISGSSPNGGVRATMRKYNNFPVNKTRKVKRCKSRIMACSLDFKLRFMRMCSPTYLIACIILAYWTGKRKKQLHINAYSRLDRARC